MVIINGWQATFAPKPPSLGKRGEEGGSVGAAALLAARGCRAHARVRVLRVSPQTQYTFIYQALLEYYLYGDTELDVSSLEKHLQTLHGSTTHFDKIGLEEEFRVSANRL